MLLMELVDAMIGVLLRCWLLVPAVADEDDGDDSPPGRLYIDTRDAIAIVPCHPARWRLAQRREKVRAHKACLASNQRKDKTAQRQWQQG